MAVQTRRNSVAATFSIFLHRGRALVAQRCPLDPLSFSLPPSRFLPLAGASLSLSLPRVYQVIGCEMKSNENPFRRVHSRSAVGRVAQPHPPLASPSRPRPLSILHTYAFPPVLHPLPAAIDVLCVSRSQPGECTTSEGAARQGENINVERDEDRKGERERKRDGERERERERAQAVHDQIVSIFCQHRHPPFLIYPCRRRRYRRSNRILRDDG